MGSITRGRRSPHRGTIAVLAAVASIIPAVGWARSMVTIPYPITAVWPASVRFLRVDRDFPVIEKDDTAGYILFEYTDGPKPCRASLELISITDSEGRDATRLAVSIPALPRRYELMFLDKLGDKMRTDYGPPPPPPKPAPHKPDAGPPAPPPAPPSPPPQPFPLPKGWSE